MLFCNFVTNNILTQLYPMAVGPSYDFTVLPVCWWYSSKYRCLLRRCIRIKMAGNGKIAVFPWSVSFDVGVFNAVKIPDLTSFSVIGSLFLKLYPISFPVFLLRLNLAKSFGSVTSRTPVPSALPPPLLPNRRDGVRRDHRSRT